MLGKKQSGQAAETPFPRDGGPAAFSAPSTSMLVRAELGGHLDPESRAGDQLAGQARVKGGRLRVGRERRRRRPGLGSERGRTSFVSLWDCEQDGRPARVGGCSCREGC